MKEIKLNHLQIEALVATLAKSIQEESERTELVVHPVPRGGVPVAYLLKQFLPKLVLTGDPADADIFVDDIIESGATMERYKALYPGRAFFAMINKEDPNYRGRYIVFPWEGNDVEDSVEDNVIRLLQAVGEDARRGGLLETPKRVVKAWQHWCSGYGKEPKDVLKTFDDGAEGYDQMIAVVDIPVYSHCEHHMAAIFGTATIAYIPDGKIVGLSKLSRLVDIFARRLQVQERMTAQIADALNEHLKPKGVGVIIKARHMCMESRGVCQQGHHTQTVALRGAMLAQDSTRAEFLSLTK